MGMTLRQAQLVNRCVVYCPALIGAAILGMCRFPEAHESNTEYVGMMVGSFHLVYAFVAVQVITHPQKSKQKVVVSLCTARAALCLACVVAAVTLRRPNYQKREKSYGSPIVSNLCSVSVLMAIAEVVVLFFLLQAFKLPPVDDVIDLGKHGGPSAPLAQQPGMAAPMMQPMGPMMQPEMQPMGPMMQPEMGAHMLMAPPPGQMHIEMQQFQPEMQQFQVPPLPEPAPQQAFASPRGGAGGAFVPLVSHGAAPFQRFDDGAAAAGMGVGWVGGESGV